MKHVKFKTLLVFSTLCLLPVTGQAESLGDAVKNVVETNPDVRSPAHNRLARDQEVRQARSGYLPTLDIEAGVGKDYNTDPTDEDYDPSLFYIKLRQNLFAGFATMNEVERQKARVLSQAYAVRAAAENTALDAARVYLDVLKAQEMKKLADENLALHEKIYDQIKLRAESGVGRKADTDQIQSRLQLARSNVVVTEQNLLDAESNYQRVVGHLPQGLTRPEVSAEFMPQTLDEAINIAVMEHPTLQSAYADLLAREEQKEAATSKYYPIIDVEVDKSWEHEVDYFYKDREDLKLFLRLRYNLFNGFKDQARHKETIEQINEAREIRNHTYRQVVESISLSWRAYEAALRRMGFLEERVNYSRGTAETYARQWALNQRTLLDVLDAEAERINAQRDLITTEFSGLYAEFRILTGIGQLLPSFGVPWPKEGEVDENLKLDGRLDKSGTPAEAKAYEQATAAPRAAGETGSEAVEYEVEAVQEVRSPAS